MRRYVVPIIVAALGVGVSIWAVVPVGTSDPEQVRSTSTGTVKPSLLVTKSDLGELWEAREQYSNIEFKNDDSRAIIVDSITASCSCLKVSPDRFRLAPGEVQSVGIIVDLLVKKRSGSRFELIITPKFRYEDETTAFTQQSQLSGTTRRPGSVVGNTDFGRIPYDGYRDRVLNFSFVTAAQFDGLLVGVCSDAHFTCSVLRNERDIRRFDVQVRATSDPGVGAFKFNLVLSPLHNGLVTLASAYPDTVISVSGSLERDVTSNPAEVQFGCIPVGETGIVVINYQSFNEKKFRIISAGAGKGDKGDVTVETDATREVRVSVTPSTPGTIRGEVTAEVEGVDGKYVVRTKYAYIGLGK